MRFHPDAHEVIYLNNESCLDLKENYHFKALQAAD